jgi:hypothetical protein
MADEKRMLSTFNRLTLVARHLSPNGLSRSPAALISTRRCQSSFATQNLTSNHRRNMYRIEERGAPNTLEHRVYFREFAYILLSNITFSCISVKIAYLSDWNFLEFFINDLYITF